ncbi:MAG: Fis family transcriptional regulator [Candidatus Riflebacteria bacterium HGW-Riflebacteria-2]|jgi:PAS domain S-box-containing protein|nr:MAG: Fis family transcriptional regulator [Candidatus Riflebacteria bacterium HGW-Riflebacteria-2]
MPEPRTPYLEDSLETIPCGHSCRALDFLQQIYHAAPIGMVVVDNKQEVIRLNRKFAELIRLDSEACIGMCIGKLLPTLASELSFLLTDVFSSKAPRSEQEFTFRLDDNLCTWSVTAYPVLRPESENTVVSLIIHDITQLRKTESELAGALNQIRALEEKLRRENQLLKVEITRESELSHMVGSSASLRATVNKIRQVAPTDATVLITGETGTGKELAAREIHHLSRRGEQPIIVVNCAALPANLIESELFGHEKGSFTGAIARKIGRFEIADGGTIFLDEIGEMPLELQSKLLRVLQESQIERIGSHKLIDIDVRVIAATNRMLHEEVKAGRFREDLYFRLNVFPIHLPALRERGNDIIEIANDYMLFCARKHGRSIKAITPASRQHLLEYSWPGNIRELRNLVERSVILCHTDTLELEIPYSQTRPHSDESDHSYRKLSSLAEVQKLHITQILERTAWRIRGEHGAAEILGLKPTTLESKMKKLGISRKSPICW